LDKREKRGRRRGGKLPATCPNVKGRGFLLKVRTKFYPAPVRKVIEGNRVWLKMINKGKGGTTLLGKKVFGLGCLCRIDS